MTPDARGGPREPYPHSSYRLALELNWPWTRAALTAEPAPTTTSALTGRGVRDRGAYTQAALRGELDRVLSASEGSRKYTLNAAAYSLGQLTGAGQLARCPPDRPAIRRGRTCQHALASPPPGARQLLSDRGGLSA